MSVGRAPPSRLGSVLSLFLNDKDLASRRHLSSPLRRTMSGRTSSSGDCGAPFVLGISPVLWYLRTSRSLRHKLDLLSRSCCQL